MLRSIKKEIRAMLIIAAFVAFYILLFKALFAISNFHVFLYGLLINVVLFIAFGLLHKKYPNNILKGAMLIFSIPYVIIRVIQPISLLSLTLLFYFIISVLIPYSILQIIQTSIAISKESFIFLLITASSLLSLMLNKSLLYIILNYGPWFKWHSKEIKDISAIELCRSILNPNNVKMVIYFCYFIYLSLYSFFLLEHKSIFISSQIDTAVMQAFFVFLAFDNLKIIRKEVDFSPSFILDKMSKVIFNEAVNNVRSTENCINEEENKLDEQSNLPK